VKLGEALIILALDHVRIEAFPQDIPHRIDVDLSPLQQLDDAIHVRDLIVDTNTVTILNDPDDLVVKAGAVKVEAEPVATTEDAEGEGDEGDEAEADEGDEAKPAAGAAKAPKA
jgi:hypothetical protein